MRKTYRMRLKVLSGLFIGSGESLNRTDYILRNGKILVIDHAKLFSRYPRLLQSFLNELNAKGGKNFVLEDWAKRNNIDCAPCLAYSIDAPALRSPNEVRPFVRDAFRRPYIPGSSLKGALVTALTAAALRRSPQRAAYFFKEYQNIPRGKDKVGELSDRILKSIWGYSRPVADKEYTIRGASGLLLGDSEPWRGAQNLTLSQKTDINLRNQEKTLSLHRECMTAGMSVEFDLTLDSDLLPPGLKLSGVAELLDLLQDHVELLYGASGVRSLVPYTASYLPPEVLKKERGVLLLGGGAGYESKTLVAALANDRNQAVELTRPLMHQLFPKHRHNTPSPVSPRNLKVTAGHLGKKVMGFCQISEVE